MTLPEFANAVAHAAVADLLRNHLEAAENEIVATAILEGKARIVVSITKHDGPARIDQTTLDKIRAMPTFKLTPLQTKIIAQLNPDTPTKAEVIAMRMGRKGSGSIRAALADLTRFGAIKHVSQEGYYSIRPNVSETC